MNLLHMNYFIAVVEHQSISRAAQSLFITQQTLSSHIASMEKERSRQGRTGYCRKIRRGDLRLVPDGRIPSYVPKAIAGIDGLRIESFSYCLPYLDIL